MGCPDPQMFWRERLRTGKPSTAFSRAIQSPSVWTAMCKACTSSDRMGCRGTTTDNAFGPQGAHRVSRWQAWGARLSYRNSASLVWSVQLDYRLSTVRRTPLIRKCLSGQGSQTGALERRLLRSRLFQSNVKGDSTGELVIRNRLD